MKRSEAIDKLETLVKLETAFPSEDSRLRATRLLRFVEDELGMLPPTYEDSSLGYNRTEGTHHFNVNEWEKEEDDYCGAV